MLNPVGPLRHVIRGRTGVASPPLLSIIIPAHNEEARIEPTLRDYLATFDDDCEIIVVLNGCSDGTKAIVDALASSDDRLHVIDIPAAIGKGGAVRAGFAVAHGAYVGFVDADGSTSAREFKRMFAEIGSFDGLIGSRWMRGSNVRLRQPFARRVASRTFNLCVRLLLGLRFHDTQCGAKIFSRSALEAVLPSVETANFAFDIDLLHALQRTGRSVREVPSEWEDRAGSRVRIVASGSRMLASLVRIRLRQSLFRFVIPLFDRFFPTATMRTSHGLRILIMNWRDVRHPKAGGAETYCHEMAKRWVAMGHSVEWLTASFPGASPTEQIDGITVHRVGNRATVYFLAPLYYLRRLRDRFDVILESENGIPFFSPLYSLKPKVLLVYHVHRRVFLERMPFPIGHLFAWIELRLVPKLYAGVPVVTISNSTREELVRYGKTSLPIGLVHPGIPAACRPGAKSESPTVAYVGRLEPYKRVDWLLEAFVDVVRALPECRLRIVGEGADGDRLRSIASRLGIGDRVDFLGFVDEESKIRELQSAWLFVNPSSMEGWGISAMEAQACGTPAVAFDVPGLREVIRDGETGKIVRDVRDLSDTLVAILRDARMRQAMQERALDCARPFRWENSAEEMLRYIRDESLEHPYHLMFKESLWEVVVPNLDDGVESLAVTPR